MTGPSERAATFRAAIAAFIEGRREAKLKGKEDDAAEVASKYDYATWLADAARRVGQIQAVTHVLKATHPDAKGSSLHVQPNALGQHAEIGTHSVGREFSEDVVGNAAALDVFKFLKVDVEGRSLRDWMLADDADLRNALHEDADLASSWMRSFNGLVRNEGTWASHEMAKQLYWLAGDAADDDAHYHLLQPMFSSTLAHPVHAELQDARFGEANKLARQAYRNREPHAGAYRNYVNLAVRKLGGTKPQNISQLNSERGGVNYLLASLPPQWKEQAAQLKHLPSVFGGSFELRRAMRPAIKALVDLLKPDPAPNMETRTSREDIEDEIRAQLLIFAETVHARFPAGWTQGAQLAQCEQLWLDPQRRGLDANFKVEYERDTWPDDVAERFSNWLNAELRKAGGTLVAAGADEARHWARQSIDTVKEARA